VLVGALDGLLVRHLSIPPIRWRRPTRASSWGAVAPRLMSDLENDVVPDTRLRPTDELVELGSRVLELRIVVPLLPVVAGLPRSDDHTPVRIALGLKQLSSDPSGVFPRGRHPLAHELVPLRLGSWLDLDLCHDGHHCMPPWVGLAVCVDWTQRS